MKKQTVFLCVAAASLAAFADLVDVEITAPSDDWSGITLPTKAYNQSVSSGNFSFGSVMPDAVQELGDNSALAGLIGTGSAATEVATLQVENDTYSCGVTNLYLVISGGTVTRAIGGLNTWWKQNDKYDNNGKQAGGNSMVQLCGDAEVDFAFGGGYGGWPAGSSNYQTHSPGSTGVTIKDNAVLRGTAVGGWASQHNKTPTVASNTWVKVLNVQSVNSATKDEALLGDSIIGGSAYRSNSSSGATVNSNSSVVVAIDVADLDLAEGETTNFVKRIIGGPGVLERHQYKANNQTKYNNGGTFQTKGNSSVVISAPNSVVFSGDVIGGGYVAEINTGGKALVGGNSSVTLNGGEYTGTIVAGGSTTSTTRGLVSGTATLTINGGVFTDATIQAGSAGDTKIFALGENVTFPDKAFTGFDAVTLASGSSITAGGSSKMTELPSVSGEGTVNVAGNLTINGSCSATINVNSGVADWTLTLTNITGTASAVTLTQGNLPSTIKVYLTASQLAADSVTIATLPAGTSSVAFEAYDAEGNARAIDVAVDATSGVVAFTTASLVWGGDNAMNWTDAGAWKYNGTDTVATFADGDKVKISTGDSILLSSTVKPASVTVTGDATITGASGAVIEPGASFVNSANLTLSGDMTVKGVSVTGTGTNIIAGTGMVLMNEQLQMPLQIESGAKAALGTQNLTNVGMTNIPYILGDGTLVFTNCEVKVQHQEEYNLFLQFHGDMLFAKDGRMSYLPRKATSSAQGEIAGQFGTGRLIFDDGTLRGFSEKTSGSTYGARASINITNDIVVVDGKTGTILNEKSSDGDACNVHLKGKISGSGTLVATTGWKDEQRRFHFSGDASGFTGTIDLSSSGGVAQIDTQTATHEGIYWKLGGLHQFHIQPSSNAEAMKFGGFDYTRNDGSRTSVNYDNLTIEIGAANEDCAISNKIYNSATPTLRKKGTATLTLGAKCTMKDQSKVYVDNGTLNVLAASLGSGVPIAVAAGATLAGTGTVHTVAFDVGAKVAFPFPDEPDKTATYGGITATSFTWTTRPAVAQPASARGGKWVASSVDNGNGTYTLTATWQKAALILIVR